MTWEQDSNDASGEPGLMKSNPNVFVADDHSIHLYFEASADDTTWYLYYRRGEPR